MTLDRPRFPLPALLAAALLCAVPVRFAAAAPNDSDVRLEVSGLRDAKGRVGCLLFATADGFPSDHAKAYAEKQAVVEAGRASCVFADVPTGTYAAIVWHDENVNGKLDKNFVGIPQEGYGASNDVRPAFSAPGFKESSFAVKAGTVTRMPIRMGY
ncbi:MAG: DUF2141 domain-containing protein [Burkholderiales bacterium]|jgi:uncharacterized protein (DUF2141 family)